MNDGIRVVGLGGSLSPRSTSLAALRVALRGAEEAGAETRLFDVRGLDLPFYDPGLDEPPRAAEEYARAVCEAHGMVWSSPMYHGTISGSFKNALDWLQLLATHDPPYLKDRVIGLISTAGGTQGLQAVNTMEFVVRALRGWAVPLVLPIPAAARVFDGEGKPTDPAVEERLRSLGAEVVRAAKQLASTGTCDYAGG